MVWKKWAILMILGTLFFLGVSNPVPTRAYGSNTLIQRLSGKNRYETSAIISKTGFVKAAAVIIASGSDYPGALLASSISRLKDAPILLTAKSSLDPAVIGEIKRLKAGRAYVMGGKAIIGDNVDKQLKGMGLSVTRLDGADNYDISKKTAEITGIKNGVIIAGKADFPEILSITPIAAIKSMPILISPWNSLSPKITDFLKGKTIPVSYLLGGYNILDASIEKAVPNSKRLDGADIYQNNLNVVKQFAGELNFNTIYLASGKYMVDALGGSVLAAKNNSPLFLTDGNSIPQNTVEFIKSKQVKQIVVFGGPDVVSGSAVNMIAAAIGSPVVHPVSIILNITAKSLNIGETFSLTASISPAAAANKTINFASSDSNIAVVDSSGKVKAVGTGSAVITAATADGNKTTSCVVNVTQPVVKVTSLNLNKTTTILKVGGTDNLEVTVNPDSASDKQIFFSSSDEGIAVVDSSGRVNAVGLGNAVVTASTADKSITTACAVTVYGEGASVEAISLNKSYDKLAVGATDRLIATVYPDDAGNKYVIFSSSDEDVATVDLLGNIKAVSTGSAIVTATTSEGNYAASCNVDVVPGQPQQTKKQLVFAIDIGHNAKFDSGAVGIKVEDVLTMEVGTKVIEKLTALGHKVVNCLPTNSKSQLDALKQRVNIANTAHADYFVSIHFNKFNGKANGSEIYMGSSKIKNKAQQVLNNLVGLGYANRGLKDNSSGLYVLKNTNMPAMLVECSFVDSQADMARYDADAIADAIVKGLVDGN